MNKHYPDICMHLKGIDYVISTMKSRYLAFERHRKNIHSAWLALNREVLYGNDTDLIIRDIAICAGWNTNCQLGGILKASRQNWQLTQREVTEKR